MHWNGRVDPVARTGDRIRRNGLDPDRERRRARASLNSPVDTDGAQASFLPLPGRDDVPPAVRVHTGQCWDTRSRCKPATPDAARQALAEGVPACPQCRPDTALGMLD